MTVTRTNVGLVAEITQTIYIVRKTLYYSGETIMPPCRSIQVWQQ